MTLPEPPAVPTGTSGPTGGAGPLGGPSSGPVPTGQRPPASGAPAPTRHRGRTIGRSFAAGLLVFVTVILVLFVVFNTQTVDISLVFGNVRAPLVLALVIAAALGGLVVALAGAALRARRSRKS